MLQVYVRCFSTPLPQPTMLCRAHAGPARAARTGPVLRFGRGRCSGPAWAYRTSFIIFKLFMQIVPFLKYVIKKVSLFACFNF